MSSPAKPFCYDYPHPALAIDIALFTIIRRRLHVLLIRRGQAPHEGALALPGGFLLPDETAEACARRELREETGFVADDLQLCGVFSEPGRDPRGWIVSVAFTAFVPADRHQLVAGTDAATAEWLPFTAVDELTLAFDHQKILHCAHAQLVREIGYGRREEQAAQDASLLLAFLPDRFTIAEAADVMTALTGQAVQRANFRKWLLATGRVEPVSGLVPTSARPAGLFKQRIPVDETGRAGERADTLIRDLSLRRIRAIDLFLASLDDAPYDIVSLVHALIDDFGDHPAVDLRCTSIPDLRLIDRETGRVIAALHWNRKEQDLICRTPLDMRSLESAGLGENRPRPASGRFASRFTVRRLGDLQRLINAASAT